LHLDGRRCLRLPADPVSGPDESCEASEAGSNGPRS